MTKIVPVLIAVVYGLSCLDGDPAFIRFQGLLGSAWSEVNKRYSSPGLQRVQYMAYACYTPYGACPLVFPVPAGSSCYCSSIYGPIWGVAR